MPTVNWQPQVSRYVNGDPRWIHYGKPRWISSSLSPTGTRWYWHSSNDYECSRATTKPVWSPCDTSRFKWLAKWRARSLAKWVIAEQMRQLKIQQYSGTEWEPV